MTYPHLDTLIKGYLNQDYAYYAETIEGVVDAYLKQVEPKYAQRVRVDIARFLHDHQGKLDEAFEAAYGFDFSPELWGLTAETFLKQLDRQLQGSAEP
jgi:hypothetical protein